MNSNRRQSDHHCRGFTLLEVLVAMAILSLGMIAVFSGMNQSLNVTTRLRDKTLASWIATNRITELQVTGDVPKAGNQRDQVEMARSEWVYDMKIANIPDLDMRRIDITVSFADTPDDILATVIGFIGTEPNDSAASEQQGGPGEQNNDNESGQGFGSGWEPPQEQFGETG
jgi:general secretion pathway protein I